MELQRTLIHIGKVEQVSEKFRKRDLIIQTQEQYPQEIKLQLVQDKCELVTNIGLNTNVSVEFNLRGKSFITKQRVKMWNNNLDVWKLKVI